MILKYNNMEKCIACLPNGTQVQKDLIKRYKQQGIKRMIFRLSEDKEWNICDYKSFNVIKKQNKNNKEFEFFSVEEFKE